MQREERTTINALGELQDNLDKLSGTIVALAVITRALAEKMDTLDPRFAEQVRAAVDTHLGQGIPIVGFEPDKMDDMSRQRVMQLLQNCNGQRRKTWKRRFLAWLVRN